MTAKKVAAGSYLGTLFVVFLVALVAVNGLPEVLGVLTVIALGVLALGAVVVLLDAR